MIRTIGSRLFAVDILRGLRKIDLEEIDLEAKRLVHQALVAVSEHRLGYSIGWGTKPELEATCAMKA